MYIYAILSPFQTIQLSFRRLNGRGSSCATPGGRYTGLLLGGTGILSRAGKRGDVGEVCVHLEAGVEVTTQVVATLDSS